jgi:hypothetical protein
MITRRQMIPLLLEACPSFGTIWGPIQRPDEHEEHIIHIAFGAFGSHLGDLSREGTAHELSAVNVTIERFRVEGDGDVKRLTAHLVESIRSLSSNEQD